MNSLSFNGNPPKNPDIETPLVLSFFAGSRYSFLATSGVFMWGSSKDSH